MWHSCEYILLKELMLCVHAMSLGKQKVKAHSVDLCLEKGTGVITY